HAPAHRGDLAQHRIRDHLEWHGPLEDVEHHLGFDGLLCLIHRQCLTWKATTLGPRSVTKMSGDDVSTPLDSRSVTKMSGNDDPSASAITSARPSPVADGFHPAGP